MRLRGEIASGVVPGYIVAQIAGGSLGAVLANAMFDLPALQISTTMRGGTGQWIAEVVATFGLLGTILGAVRYKPESVPVLVGLYITAAYWFTASTSFANPAVTIARSLSDTFAGIAPSSTPFFIAAQLAGAVAAMAVFRWLSGTDDDP